MDLKLLPAEKIRIVFGESEYFVGKPTVAQSLTLEEDLKKEGAKVSVVAVEFLVTLGLPKDALMGFPATAVDEIISAITKKKS